MKKTEVAGIYKVTEGILVNKDNEALMKYKARKSAIVHRDNEINTLKEQVGTLTNKLDSIETLLKQLMEK
jgi:hypothetical protein